MVVFKNKATGYEFPIDDSLVSLIARLSNDEGYEKVEVKAKVEKTTPDVEKPKATTTKKSIKK